MPELCIGTAQFGSKYGITNKQGVVKQKEIENIIRIANENKIKLIDTAQNYGSAEKNIGNLNIDLNSMKVISKMKPSLKSWEWNQALNESLSRLKIQKLHGLLIHNIDDLKGKDGIKRINWLKKIKEKGLIEKTGISIYEKKDLEEIDLSNIDIIQLPVSIYDQRLLQDGTIAKLRKMKKSIHARSIYMQGLMLTRTKINHVFISKELKMHHESFCKELQKNNLNQVEACVTFAKNLKDIDVILVGVQNTEELKETIGYWKSKREINFRYSDWCWTNPSDIDPRRWGTKNQFNKVID